MSGSGWTAAFRSNRAARFLAASVVSTAAALSLAASASALQIGVDPLAFQDMPEAARTGVSFIHVPIDRSLTADGTNWTTYDAAFFEAWRYGITIQPVLGQDSGSKEGRRFPKSSGWASWDAWVEKVVRRYGIGGEFWNGKLSPKPVTAWDVWNEPNLAANNPRLSEANCKAAGLPYSQNAETCAQPELYGQFLASTAAAIRNVPGGAASQVLFGGLYMGSEVSNYVSFLQKARPTGSYDGLSIHPYAFFLGVQELAVKVETMRSTLNGLGGAGKSLWIDEFGWPVANPAKAEEDKKFNEGSRPVSGIPPRTPAEQATLLTDSFNWIKANAAGLNIAAAAWYNSRDRRALPASEGRWDDFCGLRSLAPGEGGEFRPAWFAFLAEAGGTGALSPPAALPGPNDSESVYVTTATAIKRYFRSNGGPWSSEIVASGTFVSAPAAYIAPDGTENVFVNSGGGIHRYARAPGSSWGGEIVVAGTFLGAPSAYITPSGVENVFVNSGGGINRYARAPGGGWGGEIVAAGVFVGTPAVHFNPGNGVESVIVNSGGGINRYARAPGSSWGGEIVTPGVFIGSPTASLAENGVENVFVNSGGGINRYARSNGGPWNGEIVVTGAFMSAPTVYGNPGSSAESAFLNSGGGINRYARSNGKPWGGEIVTGGTFAPTLSAYATPSGVENVYVLTGGGVNRYARKNGGPWSGEIVTTLP